MSSTINCLVCGFKFDPAKNPGCASCPVHSGCTTACCPNCGATNINPQGSRLARWVEKLFATSGKSVAQDPAGLTLDLVPEGKTVRILRFGSIGAEQGRHLQAYGLLPGRAVLVLSHSPMTILQIEQTELALESAVAHSVFVDLVTPV
jgi:Fe2+ transport system protein FeoA